MGRMIVKQLALTPSVVACHLVAGSITNEEIAYSLPFTPPMFVAILSGSHIVVGVNEKHYRKCLYFLLMLMGIILLI